MSIGRSFIHFQEHVGKFVPFMKFSERERLMVKESPMKVCGNFHREGFWRDSIDDSKFGSRVGPYPYIEDKMVDKEFIRKVRSLVPDRYYNLADLGYCRLCNQKISSVVCQKGISNNKIIEYPLNLIHYYEEHNVHPSEDFYQWVMHSA